MSDSTPSSSPTSSPRSVSAARPESLPDARTARAQTIADSPDANNANEATDTNTATTNTDPAARRALLVARIVTFTIILALVATVARVYQLQTRPAPQIAQYIGAQRSGVELFGRRGALLDRNGRILANTGVAHRLFVDPHFIDDPGTFPERVGYELGYDPANVERTLHGRRDKRYVVIDQRLDDDQLLRLERANIPGVYTDLWLERQYPMGPVAGQVIGFVGRDGVGFEGAERMFDRTLRGSGGRLGYLRDAALRPLGLHGGHVELPKDGETVRLSIDIAIQRFAEEALARTCAEFGAKTAEMVVMDPFTGEVLAMANHPPFDPNEFRTTDPKLRRNRCVTDPFEPGSTFKPFVWAKGTELGFARPTDNINTNQRLNRSLRDTHDHGVITWSEVLIKSSNRGMAVVGQKMGVRKLHDAVRDYGFGDVTGIGISGESTGLVLPLDRWNPKFSVTSVPMGQEVAVTPLQLCRAACVFANDGLLVTPTIRARNPHALGSLHDTPVTHRVLSTKTAGLTRDVMRRVMTEGTGRRAQSEKYDMFGKTGTAQVAEGGIYKPGLYSSVFIGGAPYESPRVVIACVIHKPDPAKGYYGGLVAGPAVRDVIDQTLQYMGVPPKPQEDERRVVRRR